jgi:hypothetical protein
MLVGKRDHSAFPDLGAVECSFLRFYIRPLRGRYEENTTILSTFDLSEVFLNTFQPIIRITYKKLSGKVVLYLPFTAFESCKGTSKTNENLKTSDRNK